VLFIPITYDQHVGLALLFQFFFEKQDVFKYCPKQERDASKAREIPILQIGSLSSGTKCYGRCSQFISRSSFLIMLFVSEMVEQEKSKWPQSRQQ
jgi:hypothetical protein